MFTLAQIADPHLAPLPRPTIGELTSKRLLGYLSWSVRRKHIHTTEVLTELTADLLRKRPDHVAVVGDLTNIALPDEFPRALAWLRRLGDPAEVSVIPGNHDAYVRLPIERSVGTWSAYMLGDSTATSAATVGNSISFPWLRVRQQVSLVGVSTAIPTAPFLATGAVGRDQMGRLEEMLLELGKRELFRVVLIHHPPLDTLTKHRKRLVDSAELAAVLARTGAELILHGHTHEATVAWMSGPTAAIPVVATTSASANGSNEHERRARYNLFHIERAAGCWQVEMEVRALGADGRFDLLEQRPLRAETRS